MDIEAFKWALIKLNELKWALVSLKFIKHLPMMHSSVRHDICYNF